MSSLIRSNPGSDEAAPSKTIRSAIGWQQLYLDRSLRNAVAVLLVKGVIAEEPCASGFPAGRLVYSFPGQGRGLEP